jgi:Holliday junction resolvase RusA-like endonuclease
MTELHIVIPGPPRAWQRATPVKGSAHTSKSARKHKRHIRSCISAAALAARWVLAAGPVRVEIGCYQRRIPTAKPDGDNLAKNALDSANGILWRDDAQVVELTVRKHDVRIAGGEERTEVRVIVMGFEEG